jgi:hypothetical protein
MDVISWSEIGGYFSSSFLFIGPIVWEVLPHCSQPAFAEAPSLWGCWVGVAGEEAVPVDSSYGVALAGMPNFILHQKALG